MKPLRTSLRTLRTRRRSRTAASAAAVTVLLAAGGAASAAQGAGANEGTEWESATGEFEAVPGEQLSDAVTYDESLVPAGATIEVMHQLQHGKTLIKLAVEGMRPGHTYGTHVHTDPCGPAPEDAGGHYQDAPGDDPYLATPKNEVWLDFTANEAGRGTAVAVQPWEFRDDAPRAVVLHALSTSQGEDGRPPGDAGERVACFTVPFQGAERAGGDAVEDPGADGDHAGHAGGHEDQNGPPRAGQPADEADRPGPDADRPGPDALQPAAFAPGSGADSGAEER